jgi:hypothetical protein
MEPGSQSRDEAGSAAALLRWIATRAPLEAGRDGPTPLVWWEAFREHRCPWSAPIDQAVVGGLRADRLGFAFAAGYQAALRRLVPSLPVDRLASICVTEEGGAHPRAIATTLRDDPAGRPGRYRLSGRKMWATLSCDGALAVVIASTGIDSAGRPRLRAVRLPLDAAGVTVTPMPPTAFTPEISHGSLRFDDVAVAEPDLLPGDAYVCYVKPFRTVEDVHVLAAVTAYLLGVAMRFDFPEASRQDLLLTILALRGLAPCDPSAPEVHLALDACIAAHRRALQAVEARWSSVDVDVRSRWQRDVGLLEIAGRARMQRLAAARRILAPGGAQSGRPGGE